jgi:hypothetical protein
MVSMVNIAQGFETNELLKNSKIEGNKFNPSESQPQKF